MRKCIKRHHYTSVDSVRFSIYSCHYNQNNRNVMAEKSKNLTSERCWFREKIVKIGKSEYVSIGIDPVSMKPMVRICNTDGTTTTYVSFESIHLGSFTTHLHQKLDGDEWSCDCSGDGSGVFVTSIVEDICSLTSHTGETVAISVDAGYWFVSNPGFLEIYTICREYDRAYQHYEPKIMKHIMMVYKKHFEESYDQLKTDLSKYIEPEE